MHFPVYIYLLLIAIILLLALCAIYFYIYKRRVNAALHGAAPRRPLPAPFHVAAVLTVVMLVLAVCLSFVVGFGMGYRAMDEPEGEIDVDAFYAHVTAVEGETLTVEGMEWNPSAQRGELTLRLYPGLPVERGSQTIDAAQLRKGDAVCIILLTDVTGIEEIFKIKVLD